MYFGNGKRKGKSAFKVIDVSSKKRTSVVNFPSCWSTSTSFSDKEEQVSYSEMMDDDSPACVDEESDGETSSTPYRKRRERLCRDWEV